MSKPKLPRIGAKVNVTYRKAKVEGTFVTVNEETQKALIRTALGPVWVPVALLIT